MTDQQLIALIKERGIQAVAALFKNGGINAALDEGIDLTGWRCNAVQGALLFYQVEYTDEPHGRINLRTANRWTPARSAITTDAPRVMYINSPPTPEMEAMADTAKTDAPVTVIYNDGTMRRVDPSMS